MGVHLVIPVFGKMRKLNGQVLHATAPGMVANDIPVSDLKEFNRKADEWLANRGEAVGNWKSRDKRKLQHRSAKAAVNRRRRLDAGE